MCQDLPFAEHAKTLQLQRSGAVGSLCRLTPGQPKWSRRNAKSGWGKQPAGVSGQLPESGTAESAGEGIRMEAKCLQVTLKERGFQRCSRSSGLGGEPACRLPS